MCYKQQNISHFFTIQVPEKEANHVKKDINNSNVASLFSKQMAKSKITNNARKSHEKKKPFECDICNAGFTENALFIDHISSVHEGNKHDEGVQMFIGLDTNINQYHHIYKVSFLHFSIFV